EAFTRTAKIVGGLAPIIKLPLPFLRAAARIVERVSHALHIPPIITSDLVAGAGRYNWYSSAKAQRELGYSITRFEVAVERAYQWYRRNNLL
ncbi:MAG: hypothetical protein HY961_16140, partial [Ignavibacteriae bacterium]|nr:hypothetical protein [Ignavibacteriota bacterium]